jgi:hypothetical protein
MPARELSRARPAAGWQPLPDLEDLLGRAQETARGILESEQALDLVRRQREQADDADADGELAAEALEHVERQLALVHERRRQLDRLEAKLWARRNGLEGVLIRARGSGWWREHRKAASGAQPRGARQARR